MKKEIHTCNIEENIYPNTMTSKMIQFGLGIILKSISLWEYYPQNDNFNRFNVVWP